MAEFLEKQKKPPFDGQQKLILEEAELLEKADLSALKADFEAAMEARRIKNNFSKAKRLLQENHR